MRYSLLFFLMLVHVAALGQTDAVPPTKADTLAPAVEMAPVVLFRSGTFEAVLKEAKLKNKPVFIDFWATWCAPCRRLDRETFTNAELGDFVNTNFIPYRVNIDEFTGMDLVDKYGVKAYPTMLVVNPAGKVILRTIVGFYLPDYLRTELTVGLRKSRLGK